MEFKKNSRVDLHFIYFTILFQMKQCINIYSKKKVNRAQCSY